MTSADLLHAAALAAPLGVSWLLTYALHSTLLLGGAWILTQRAVESHSVREVIWKAALVGSIATATLQVGMGIEPMGGSLALSSGVFVAQELAAPAFGSSDRIAPSAGQSSADESSASQTNASQSSTAAAPVRPASSDATLGEPATPFFPLAISPKAAAASHSSTPHSPLAGDKPGRLPLAALLLLGWAGLAATLLTGFFLRRLQLAVRLGRRRAVVTGRLAELLAALRRAAGIRRPIRLTMAAGLSSPVALGSSEICVPDAAITELEPDQQRSMLAHELAHLDRLDPHWLTLACLLERIFFFQPFNHLARRRIQDAAEFLCDDWAVRRTGSGLTLAKCLVKVAEWLDTTPQAVPLSGIAERRSQLVSRIHRLIENRAMITQPKRPWLVPLAAVLLVATVAAAPGVTTRAHGASATDSTLMRGTPEAAVVDTPPAAVDSADAEASTMSQSVRQLERRLHRLSMTRSITAERMARRYADRAVRAPTAATIRSMLRPAMAPMAPMVPMTPMAPMAPRTIGISPMIAPVAPARLRHNIELALEVSRMHGRMRDTSGVAVPALIAALKDPEVEVRRAAAQSLGNLQDPRAVTALIEALHDSDTEVRKSAAEALGNLRDRRAVDGLSAALKDPNPEVREVAAHALGDMEDARAADALAGALRDTSAAVRKDAAWALSQMKDPRAVEPLIAALRDADPEVREMAASSLGDLEDKRAVRPLAALLNDPSADVRQAAINSLSNFKDPAATDGFIVALKDKNADVRSAAANAIGNLELTTAPAALLDALKDPNADVRSNAANAVGGIRDPRAVPALRALLDDGNGDVRENAINALSEIRDSTALDAIIGALKSKDPNVRRQAASALGQRN